MDDQNKNLLLATALSMVVILVWFLLFPPPEPVKDPNAPVATETDMPLSPDGVATAPRAAPSRWWGAGRSGTRICQCGHDRRAAPAARHCAP